jgi:hypothetical protein
VLQVLLKPYKYYYPDKNLAAFPPIMPMELLEKLFILLQPDSRAI